MNYDYTLTWGPTPSGGCATLKYFDDDYETELWEVKGTKYLYNIEDSIAYNRKGEYMGEFFPFGKILNPYLRTKRMVLSPLSIKVLKDLPLNSDMVDVIISYCIMSYDEWLYESLNK